MPRGARANVECTACPWSSVRARDTCTADDCPKCGAAVRRIADKPVAPRGLRDEERARERLARRRELRRKSPAAGAEVVQHADETTGERLE